MQQFSFDAYVQHFQINMNIGQISMLKLKNLEALISATADQQNEFIQKLRLERCNLDQIHQLEFQVLQMRPTSQFELRFRKLMAARKYQIFNSYTLQTSKRLSRLRSDQQYWSNKEKKQEQSNKNKTRQQQKRRKSYMNQYKGSKNLAGPNLDKKKQDKQQNQCVRGQDNDSKSSITKVIQAKNSNNQQKTKFESEESKVKQPSSLNQVYSRSFINLWRHLPKVSAFQIIKMLIIIRICLLRVRLIREIKNAQLEIFLGGFLRLR